MPAGSEVELLERAERYRRTTEMFRVRVLATRAVGYLFLAQRELAPGCPVAWPEALDPWRELPASEFEVAYFRRGTFPLRARVFADGVTLARVRTERTVVTDGDTLEDELVVVEANDRPDRAGLALVRHSPQGWRADFVGEDGSSEHHGRRWDAPFRAAGGVFLVAVAVESFEQDQEPVRQEHYDVMRVHPDGSLRTVWTASTWNNSREVLTFSDGGGDRVRVTSSSARTQLLRWDPARFRLSP